MRELSRERYRFLQYHFVEFFIEHLSDLSRVFGGDLQEMLVLAIIGQVFLHADAQGKENASIGASRIADVTAIPRQTVRRKLQSLERRGWVQQLDGGGWQLVLHEQEAAAQKGLHDLDRRTTERVIKLVEALYPHLDHDHS